MLDEILQLTLSKSDGNLFPSTDAHVYPAGVELFCQGADALAVYLLESGVVKLFRSEGNGRRVLLDLRFPGSLIGAPAVLTGKHHPFTATTSTTCRLFRWRAQQFHSLIAEDALISTRVREVLSNEVLRHIARISQIACLPARQRLEHFLWQLCEGLLGTAFEQRCGTTNRFQLPVKHYELAELLSITPTYLSRLLNALEVDNIICRKGGWIVLAQPANLWHSEDG